LKLMVFRMGLLKSQNQRLMKKRDAINKSLLALDRLIDQSRRELDSSDSDLSLEEIRQTDRPNYSAETAEGVIEFVRYEVPGDGDCGFHSLRIKRKDVISKILDHLNDPAIRRAFAGQIYADLAMGEFQGPDSNPAPDPGMDDLEHWVPSEPLVRKYVEEKVAREWLTLGTQTELLKQTVPSMNKMPELHEPGATLEAIALLNKLNVRVWTLVSPRKLKLAAIFTYGSDGQFEDMLNLGGYHFVPLAKKEDSHRCDLLSRRPGF